MPKYRPLEERFWEKVEKTDGCWLWCGSRHSTKGYGSVGLGGGRSGKSHRVAWELTHGPIPAGLHVLHSCDNPPCCNPAHLRLGTNRDNMRDRVERTAECPNGHPRTPENTTVRASGRRVCRMCKNESSKRHYRKNPAKRCATAKLWRQAHPEKVNEYSRNHWAKQRAAR